MEYALILVLVAVVVIVVLALLGPAIGNIFSGVVCQLQPGSSVCQSSAAYACTAPTLIDQAAVQDKADNTSYCQSNKGDPFKLWYVCSTSSYVGTTPSGGFGGDSNYIASGAGTCSN